MSRIGKKVIQMPENVTVEISGRELTVRGSGGELTQLLPVEISVSINDKLITVDRTGDSLLERSAHGLVRTLINNMVIGVSTGFIKQLELQGVGYRAILNGNVLQLSLGFSHPIDVISPDGITFKVEKNIISVSGINKALVGEISAKIRSHRKPEPYKGKGIRYVGEYVRRKAGKAAKA